jgi:uncharacterized protein YlzI (FlbEa/FlbD family)
VAIALVVALHLIVLHGVDGHNVEINPSAVTSMREARDCMVNLADGKFVAVKEDCGTVKTMIEGNIK